MADPAKNFEQWIKTIEEMHFKTIDLDLSRISEVAQKGHWESLPCPVVMVAGTNGKGSTVASLAQLLMHAGLKVGTYTSPHLLQFNERIQINGKVISDERLIEAFEQIEAKREQISLTFFEFTTLAALSIFNDPQYALDIVILEVGMGGRLDAVNLISPNLAIITSLGLDHQEFLGETLEQIGREKAGIFRSHIPVILGSSANINSVLEQARYLENRIYLEGKDFDYDSPLMEYWHFDGKKIKVPEVFLPSSSVSIAFTAYTILGNELFSLPDLSEIIFCLKNKQMIGRAHLININKTTVIFDVAHNEAGGCWLAKQLAARKKNGKILAVWSSLKDKDQVAITAPFKNIIDEWYIGKLNVERESSLSSLEQTLRLQAIAAVHVFTTIPIAFKAALEIATENDIVIVFGSFYTVSQVLAEFEFNEKLLEHNGLMDVCLSEMHVQ